MVAFALVVLAPVAAAITIPQHPLVRCTLAPAQPTQTGLCLLCAYPP
jgi:hypothetical protein